MENENEVEEIDVYPNTATCVKCDVTVETLDTDAFVAEHNHG